MEKQRLTTPDSLAGLDLGSAHIAITRIQLRLTDAHRERTGADDLNVGYRTGLMHALNITSNVRNDMEAAERNRRGGE